MIKTRPTDTDGGSSTSRLISEIFGPAPLGTVLLAAAALAHGFTGRNALAGLVAIVFVTAAPFAGLRLLVRRGHVDDHHVSDRRKRAPILMGVFLSMIVGFIFLALLGAPAELYAMMIGIALGLVSVLVINLVWKLSIHAAVSAYFTIALSLLFGPFWLVTVFVPLTTGRARVKLGAHTKAQVMCGWLLGIGIAAAYAWVRTVSA